MTKEIRHTPFSPLRGVTTPLFPIQIFRGTLPLNHDTVAQSVRNAIDPIRQKTEQTDMNYTTYFFDEVREEMHNESWFKDFSDIIKDTYVNWLSENYGYDFTKNCRDDIHLFAWANQYLTPNYHEPHNHPDTIVSGTYYVKVDSDSSPIKFYSPNPAASVFGGSRPKTIHHTTQPHTNIATTGYGVTHQEAFVHPTEGEVLMWPSYLLHGVPSTESKDPNYERISISFNLHHRGIITNNETGRNLNYDFLGKTNE